MYLITKAHRINGVVFLGAPKFIHPSAVIDTSAEVIIGKDVVISTGVLILTHDYSYTVGLKTIGETPNTDIAIIDSVLIGDNCFIGANSLVLLGSSIKSNSIIGAASLVRGNFEENSIIAGNPAKKIASTDEWIHKLKNKGLKASNFIIDKK